MTLFKKMLSFSILSLVAQNIFAQSAPALPACSISVEQSHGHLAQKFPSAIGTKTVAELAQTTELLFENKGFNDEDLVYLCPLTALERLKIYNDGRPAEEALTGKNLAYFNHLVHLTYMDLDGNHIKAEDLAQITALHKMAYLQYGYGNPVGNGSLESLGLWTSLKMLRLESTGLVTENIRWMGKSKHQWKWVSLAQNPDIGNELLPYLATANIERLSISQTGISSSVEFESLAAMTSLKSLNMTYLPMTPAELALSVSKLKNSNIEELFVGFIAGDINFAHALASMTHLKEFTVNVDKPQLDANLQAYKDSVVEIYNTNKNLKIYFPASFMVLDEQPADALCASIKEQYPDAQLYYSSEMPMMHNKSCPAITLPE